MERIFAKRTLAIALGIMLALFGSTKAHAPPTDNKNS